MARRLGWSALLALLGAFVLHSVIGQPRDGWRRCLLYAIVIAGLALPAIEAAWKRDPGLVLALAYPVAFLFWDPASSLPAVFPLATAAWIAGVVLASTRHARVLPLAGLAGFWTAEAWLFVTDALSEGSVRSVSLFSKRVFD